MIGARELAWEENVTGQVRSFSDGRLTLAALMDVLVATPISVYASHQFIDVPTPTSFMLILVGWLMLV